MDELEAVVRANHEVFMLTGDRIATVLADHGLTHATAQALCAIDPAEEPPSMKAVAGRLHCNAPNLSFVTDQLVGRGLVTRVADPRDRRSRVLVLTDAGRRVRADVMRATLRQTPLAGLDEADLKTLAAILDRALHG
ncbi:MarR family winged helix-turn-helix transcriptional regulator [Saccharothrix longispora]|uniref:DNA-binding MarR family transcriptional regulator n=1 Tax=Saccharothrix longispora TaxID=33920 RepID=A0ABU1PQG8_9PSEU|nr:MarR family transcriptional regulator [Saccharothrix longispora]MDR6592885.1 DNA-binding MarR family transcriptional regulator [Saccharothrix longispora]